MNRMSPAAYAAFLLIPFLVTTSGCISSDSSSKDEVANETDPGNSFGPTPPAEGSKVRIQGGNGCAMEQAAILIHDHEGSHTNTLATDAEGFVSLDEVPEQGFLSVAVSSPFGVQAHSVAKGFFSDGDRWSFHLVETESQNCLPSQAGGLFEVNVTNSDELQQLDYQPDSATDSEGVYFTSPSLTVAVVERHEESGAPLQYGLKEDVATADGDVVTLTVDQPLKNLIWNTDREFESLQTNWVRDGRRYELEDRHETDTAKPFLTFNEAGNFLVVSRYLDMGTRVSAQEVFGNDDTGILVGAAEPSNLAAFTYSPSQINYEFTGSDQQRLLLQVQGSGGDQPVWHYTLYMNDDAELPVLELPAAIVGEGFAASHAEISLFSEAELPQLVYAGPSHIMPDTSSANEQEALAFLESLVQPQIIYRRVVEFD